jgi:hypothetical protein
LMLNSNSAVQRRLFNQRIKGDQRKARAYTSPTLPDPRVLSYFPTLLHPRSSAGVISSAHRDSFSFLFTQSTKQWTQLTPATAGQALESKPPNARHKRSESRSMPVAGAVTAQQCSSAAAAAPRQGSNVEGRHWRAGRLVHSTDGAKSPSRALSPGRRSDVVVELPPVKAVGVDLRRGGIHRHQESRSNTISPNQLHRHTHTSGLLHTEELHR